MVSRANALACFLKRHPEFAPFSQNLAEVRSDQDPFRFDEGLWKKASSP